MRNGNMAKPRTEGKLGPAFADAEKKADKTKAATPTAMTLNAMTLNVARATNAWLMTVLRLAAMQMNDTGK
ncbi:MAG TPA: hypothetical protein VG145_08015 [Xanthobacteraceae bacterium]|jgi:hypothetical protein|nr:hypothetical protein [Xanthobacteraceae bacterium]